MFLFIRLTSVVISVPQRNRTSRLYICIYVCMYVCLYVYTGAETEADKETVREIYFKELVPVIGKSEV